MQAVQGWQDREARPVAGLDNGLLQPVTGSGDTRQALVGRVELDLPLADDLAFVALKACKV